MISIILSTSLVFISIACFILYKKLHYKYNILIDKVGYLVEELNTPLRHGYYTISCTQNSSLDISVDYTSFVYVSEIDRYTNGESKLKIDRIELSSDSSDFGRHSAEEFTRKNFTSIMKTTDIIWLESEQTIKDNRKNKLKQLRDATKNIK